MTLPGNGDLLSQAAARELLKRAGQIDLDSTSVEHLRMGAREAGISEAAFEAALLEMRRGKTAKPASPRRGRIIAGGLAATVLIVASFLIGVSRVTSTGASAVRDHEIVVKCVPMRTAHDIAQRTLLHNPENEVQASAGSRILRVRATDAQVKTLEATFESIAKEQTSCDIAPLGR